MRFINNNLIINTMGLKDILYSGAFGLSLLMGTYAFSQENNTPQIEKRHLLDSKDVVGKVKYFNGIPYVESDAEILGVKINNPKNKKIAISLDSKFSFNKDADQNEFFNNHFGIYNFSDIEKPDNGIIIESSDVEDYPSYIFRKGNKILEGMLDDQEVTVQLTKGGDKSYHNVSVSVQDKRLHIHGNCKIINGKYEFQVIFGKLGANILMEEIEENNNKKAYPIIIDPCGGITPKVKFEKSNGEYKPIFEKVKQPAIAPLDAVPAPAPVPAPSIESEPNTPVPFAPMAPPVPAAPVAD